MGKLKLARVKVCVCVCVCCYVWSYEAGDEVRERFWNDLDIDLDILGNKCQFCMPRGLNGWVRDSMREGISDTPRI